MRALFRFKLRGQEVRQDGEMLCLRKGNQWSIQQVHLPRPECLEEELTTRMTCYRATKIIAQTKERERLEAAAALEEREFEADDDQEELEIEGLETRTDHIRARAENDEEEEVGDEYEEEAPVVKRRPIIELQ